MYENEEILVKRGKVHPFDTSPAPRLQCCRDRGGSGVSYRIGLLSEEGRVPVQHST